MRGPVVPCLFGCLVAGACSGLTDSGSRNEQTMQTLRHPDGFAVRFDSDAFSAEQTERGYHFVAAGGGERRSPSEVDVMLEQGAEAAGSWPESRELDGRRVRYRIATRPGGSAGDLFVLTAWVECSAHHLVVRQEAQAETPAEADFTPAWSILSGTTCPA